MTHVVYIVFIIAASCILIISNIYNIYQFAAERNRLELIS